MAKSALTPTTWQVLGDEKDPQPVWNGLPASEQLQARLSNITCTFKTMLRSIRIAEFALYEYDIDKDNGYDNDRYVLQQM